MDFSPTHSHTPSLVTGIFFQGQRHHQWNEAKLIDPYRNLTSGFNKLLLKVGFKFHHHQLQLPKTSNHQDNFFYILNNFSLPISEKNITTAKKPEVIYCSFLSFSNHIPSTVFVLNHHFSLLSWYCLNPTTTIAPPDHCNSSLTGLPVPTSAHLKIIPHTGQYGFFPLLSILKLFQTYRKVMTPVQE